MRLAESLRLGPGPSYVTCPGITMTHSPSDPRSPAASPGRPQPQRGPLDHAGIGKTKSHLACSLHKYTVTWVLHENPL